MSLNNLDIRIFDTTLVDGLNGSDPELLPGLRPTLELAADLALLGVDAIELPSRFTKLAEAAATIGRQQYEVQSWNNEGPVLVLSRPPIISASTNGLLQSDIETTWSGLKLAERPIIQIEVPTDRQLAGLVLPGANEQEVLDNARRSVNLAYELSEQHSNAGVQFTAYGATTSEPRYLERVIKEAIDSGANIISVPDTLGQRSPYGDNGMYSFYSRVVRWAIRSNRDVTIAARNYNDLGNATSNTLALVQAAAFYAQVQNTPVKLQLETTVCGIGARAGNADVFPVVGGLFRFAGDRISPAEWRFNPRLAVSLASKILSSLGLTVSDSAPVVGERMNVKRFQKPITYDALGMYESFNPSSWGHNFLQTTDERADIRDVL